MNKHHEAQDSVGAYAADHPEIKRRGSYVPLGCDHGGRVIDGIRHYPADACTGWGCDEDQSEPVPLWDWLGPIFWALLAVATLIALYAAWRLYAQ